MGKTLTTTIRLAGKLDASVDAMIKKTQKLIDNMRKSMNGKGQGGGATAKPFANVEEAVKKSSQSMSVLGKRLNSINDGLKLNPTSLNLITQKQQTLGRMIDTSKTKLAALKQTQQEFISSGGDLGSDKYQELCTEIQNCENALERLNGQQNNFSPRVQQFGARMTQVSEATGKAAQAFAPLSAASGAALGSSVKVAADFESAINQIAATKGLSTTDEQVMQLRDKAEQLGATTAFSAKEAAEGLNILSMAGYKTGEALDMSEPMLNLALAGQVSMDQSAAFISTTLKGFGKGADQAAQVADRIAKGSSAAATDVGQLGAAFADASATSAAYGQNMDDVGVALLRLADQGVTGTAAGTALAAVEKNLYTASDQGAKAMEKLGVKAYDAAGKARPINDVVNDINASLQGMNDQEKSDTLSKIFDIQGADAYKKMIATTAEKQQEFQAAMTGSDGAAAQMAETQAKGLNGAIKSFQSAFEGMQIKIGDAVNPYLEKGVNFMTGLISKFNQASPAVHKFTALGLGGLAAAAPALFGISKLTGGIGKFIDKAGRANTMTGKLAGGIGKLFGKKSKGASPLSGMSESSTAELTGIQTKAQGVTSRIGSMFQGMGNGISTAFRGIGQGISTAFQGITRGISTMSLTGAAAFAVTIGTISLALVGLAKCRGDILPFLQGLSDILSSLAGGLLQAFGAFLIQIAGVLPTVATAMANLSPLIEAFGTAFGNAAPGIAALGTAISEVAQGIGEAIATIAEGIGQAIATIVEAIGNAAPSIAAGFETVINAISNCVAQIGNSITQVVVALQPIISDITNLLTTLITNIQPIVQEIGDTFTKLGDAIKTALDGVSGVIDSIGGAIRSFFDGIAGVIDSVGNAALNAGQGFKLMGEGLKIITSCDLGSLIGSLGSIALAIGPIASRGNAMLDLGQGFQTMASSMMMLSASFSSMQGSLQAIPGLLTQVSASMDQITGINDKLAPAVAGVQASLTSMQTAFSTVYAAILTTVTTAMNRLPQITTTAMSQVLTITTTMLSGLSAIVTSMMAGVVAAFQSAMAQAVAAVSAGMAQIRGIMSVAIQGPKLAVPHVSVSGSFSLNPPSAPQFSVSYYKNGGILSGAQLFGMMGNTGLVGGEAGPEAVLPLSTLWDKMDTILSNAIATVAGYRSNAGRLINSESAPVPSGGSATGFVVNFSPVINISGGNGEGTAGVESAVSSAISRAKDDLMDELEDLFRERMERAYA